MSNKKMKGTVLDSSVYGDSKAMLKHQILLHDFQDLRKDVEASRYKLGRMKQKKEALLAEVRFLRRRYKYLLKSKSANLTQEHLTRYVENQGENSAKVHISNKKEGIPRVMKLKRKGGGILGKEDLIQNTVLSSKKQSRKKPAHAKPPTTLNLHPPSGQLYKGKEVTHRNFTPVVNLNQERVYNRTYAAMRNAAPTFDMNQNETAFSGNQSHFKIQAPTFDLNRISREEEEEEEEEELQNNCEGLLLEEPKKGLINEYMVSDLRQSLCRNIGNSSNNAAVKRKISWQDPVALRV